MTQCNVIAIDLAKDIFQVCIMTTNGKITFNKAMSRAKLKEWLVKQKRSLVAMESCGGAHYWARGFVGAFIVHGLLSIFGLSVLLTNSAEAFFVVKLIGALYLSWVGIKSLISAFKHKENIIPETTQSKNKTSGKTLLKAFIEGLLTNGLNPKVSMFYLAAFPQFIPVGEHSVMHAIMLVSTHALINVIWFSIMVILFAKLTTAAKNENFQRILKGVTGVIFVGFGAKLLALENK